MREIMQKLNEVKYALSEEEKEKLIKEGFVPVKSAGACPGTGQNPGIESQPDPDQKAQQKSGQKAQQKSGQKSQQKQAPEPGQGPEGTSNQEPQPEAVQAGDGNA